MCNQWILFIPSEQYRTYIEKESSGKSEHTTFDYIVDANTHTHTQHISVLFILFPSYNTEQRYGIAFQLLVILPLHEI